MDDCLIVGGGVIGLSLAYDLSGHGLRVRVIERQSAGRESSWAGAGIIPSAPRGPAPNALAHLAALSHSLHAEWAAQLLDETGIDNGYRRSGGIHLADSMFTMRALSADARAWRSQGIHFEPLTPEDLGRLEPGLSQPMLDDPVVAYHLPDEAQVRNPRHLRALLSALAARGVPVHENLPLRRFEGAGRVNTVWAGNERFTPGHVCIASGAWTGEIARNLGFELSVKPIRGQIVLLKTPSKLFSRIVNVGPRYLVPREDGRILVGSTEEDVGFDPSTTAAAVSGLLDFALSQAPGLKQAEVERAWAGLRPATPDGLPYLGRVPGFDNLFVAAGHFRSGLSLSCASARVVGQLVRGAAAEVDLADFQVGRAEAHVSSSSPHR